MGRFMGLIFEEYHIDAYCPKCRINYVSKVGPFYGKPSSLLNKCSKCNRVLYKLSDLNHYKSWDPVDYDFNKSGNEE